MSTDLRTSNTGASPRLGWGDRLGRHEGREEVREGRETREGGKGRYDAGSQWLQCTGCLKTSEQSCTGASPKRGRGGGEGKGEERERREGEREEGGEREVYPSVEKKNHCMT